MKTYKEVELLNELQQYFQVRIIGSFLLFLDGLLKYESVNDIDLFITKERVEGARKYLASKGYKAKTKRAEYSGVIVLDEFENKGFKTIHLVQDSSEKSTPVYTTKELLTQKFVRGEHKDYVHLLEVLKILGNNGAN